MATLAAVPAPALLLHLGTILLDMTNFPARVAANLDHGRTTRRVAEDALRLHALSSKFAHSFRRIFVHLSACGVQVETVASLALAAKAANQAFWII
jgi:hypothetical protein